LELHFLLILFWETPFDEEQIFDSACATGVHPC